MNDTMKIEQKLNLVLQTSYPPKWSEQSAQK